MTDSFRTYLFSICAAAVLSVLVPMLISKNMIRKTTEFACGLLLLVVVVSPVVQLDLTDFRQIISSYMLDPSTTFAEQNAAEGNFTAERISLQCEEYILDKAEAIGMNIQVEVHMNEDMLYPLPVRVMISGRYSPWQKEKLSFILEQDLGVPENQQEWEYK